MSPKKTTLKNPVSFPTTQEQERIFPIGEQKEHSGQDFSLRKLVNNAQFKKLLHEKNIFIFGKVGFFDLILTELKIAHKNTGGDKLMVIQTESELNELIETVGNKNDSKQTIVLVPAVETQDSLNHLLSVALATKFPVWLVALPSQIHKQLLLSFNWFFIPSSPVYEITILANITPISDGDIEALTTQADIVAIFAADQKISNLGIPDRLGTVVYINKISDSR